MRKRNGVLTIAVLFKKIALTDILREAFNGAAFNVDNCSLFDRDAILNVKSISRTAVDTRESRRSVSFL